MADDPGTSGSDTYADINADDTINGQGRSDTLGGGLGSDLLGGGAGNDLIVSLDGEGPDMFDGGAGLQSVCLDRTGATTSVALTLVTPGTQSRAERRHPGSSTSRAGMATTR